MDASNISRHQIRVYQGKVASFQVHQIGGNK